MRTLPLISVLTAFGTLSACSGGDLAGDFGPNDEATAGDGDSDSGGGSTEGGGDGDGDGDGDGEDNACDAACGDGVCLLIDEVEYCDCPEGTQWGPDDCQPCPVLDEAVHDLHVEVITFSGRFLLDGAPPPKSEYDDANLWLENLHTGDRARLGNTHDGQFSVRVTPGVYDVVYVAETIGDQMPANSRALIGKVPLFNSLEQDLDIPVALRTGDILIGEAQPPKDEYDDALISFRDKATGDEVVVGNTHDGGYAVALIPGTYEVVYRVETAGAVVPRNDGAVLDTLSVVGKEDVYDVVVPSIALSGEFLLDGAPPPASEYEDANIELSSSVGGTVRLGNTHDGSYSVNVIPGDYDAVYLHESGKTVPQNAHGWFAKISALESAVVNLDVPVVDVMGSLTINGSAPPASDYDDGILRLRGTDSDDQVLLGNTHDGVYAVKLVPGSYDVYYAQETAGGTVPQNKGARLGDIVVDAPMSVDLDVDAVVLSGSFTLNGGPPPSSEYEDGRVYLREQTTGDAILLGSTHEGSYSAIVVPGSYEAFYVQETGGEVVPGNQNASLGQLQVGGPMNLDLNIAVAELSGTALLAGQDTPKTPSDGGELYLRALNADAVYLGSTYDADYGAKLVAGTYGVYYRSGQSVTMPQNENGRIECVTVN